MGSDSTNNDDKQEKGGDDASNAVQDDHGYCGCRRSSQDTVSAASILRCDGGGVYIHRILQSAEKLCGRIAIFHRVDDNVVQTTGGEDATGCIQAEEDNAPGCGGACIRGCKGLAGGDVACICGVVAADISYIGYRQTVDVGFGCINQVALQRVLLASNQYG